MQCRAKDMKRTHETFEMIKPHGQMATKIIEEGNRGLDQGRQGTDRIKNGVERVTISPLCKMDGGWMEQ